MKWNKNLKALLVGGNIWYFGEGMFGPLFAVFTEKVGGDILEISWAWAIYLILAGVISLFVGKITDKYNNEDKIMILGYLLNTIFTFSYIFVSNSIELFFVQAGLGIASALATPTWNTLFAKYEIKKHDGFLWGFAEGTSEIITGIGIIIGGFILYYFSFNILFIIMGTVQAMATFFQSRIIKN